MNLLSQEFLANYEGVKPPFTELGEFVYYRTYSRWLEDKGRRETWFETCKRAVEYNVGLELKHYKNKPLSFCKLQREAEELFDAMFNLKQFLSGRTLWVGGTEVAEKYPTSNFNCAFVVMNDFEDFGDLFYLLMVGTGMGFRALKSDVEKFPSHRTNVQLYLKPYEPVGKGSRKECTTLDITKDGMVATIHVGDSKEGWTEALNMYFRIMTHNNYKTVQFIEVSFDSVRPKGERLKTFGGTASGHGSLENMFSNVHEVMIESDGKLKPIDVLDIANHIGENVVVGGVRRTAEICLSDDEEVIWAKDGIYMFDDNGNFLGENKKILHRRMSNNSVYFEQKPTREYLSKVMKSIRLTGEPGFINSESAKKRRKDFEGCNPCGEILLQSNQLCNLTTVNVLAFLEDGKINIPRLVEAVKRGARAGLRMTLVDLELPKWDNKQKSDRLVGASLTGWQDLMDLSGYDKDREDKLLQLLKMVVRTSVEVYAEELGVNVPLLATTVKPEGTISQLPSVSSGLHYGHAPYFIRRVRINAHDPLCKVAEELGWRMSPEVGQTEENCNTKVIEFPVKSGIKTTKYDVSAIQQLENYKMFMNSYVEHNASITVSVRNHEWEDVEQWVWDNWDEVIGITFLSLDEATYPLAPYEAITEEEYEIRKKEIKPFDADMLERFEKSYVEFEILDNECVNGVCPVK